MVRRREYYRRNNGGPGDPASQNQIPAQAQQPAAQMQSQNQAQAQVNPQRIQQEHGGQRENTQPQREYAPAQREHQAPREQGQREQGQREHAQAARDNGQPARENGFQRNFHREGREGSRANYSAQGPAYRGSRFKADETVDDIKEDIIRIEKEIQLEIKEIRSMKLGL